MLAVGNTVCLRGTKKVDGRKTGGAALSLPKIRRNPLIEIIAINTGYAVLPFSADYRLLPSILGIIINQFNTIQCCFCHDVCFYIMHLLVEHMHYTLVQNNSFRYI